MAKKMDLTASLRLNTKEFRNGINSVLKSLNGLKSAFTNVASALGVGLGLGKIVSEAKKTATELSVAMAVLENASKITNKAGEELNNYATNLQFVRRISKDYKQDILALTNTFGQFTAAANQVKDAQGNIALSLDEQRYIYEQLTRAAAGYHMSADRTKDMMNAIVQMMSKGKIAAEELRRQLGNSLPGAFGIMAAAMGVSNAELEDMMRKGQVMTVDALPKFARMLEGITEHMNFDSLQGSTNELKNAWVELVGELNLSATFKTLTDTATKFLVFLKDNIDNLTGWLVGVLSGGVIFSALNGLSKKITETNNKWRASLAQLDADNRRVMGAMTARNNKYFDAITRKTDNGQRYFSGLNVNGGQMIDDPKFQKALGDRVKAITEYNNKLLEMDRLNKKLGNQSLLTSDDIKNIKTANKELSKMVTTMANMPQVNGVIARGWQRLKGLALEIGVAVRSIAISTIAMAAFSALVGYLTKIYTNAKLWREEQERINKLVPDFEKSINSIKTGTTQTATNIKKLTDSLKNMDKNSPEYASKIQEINKQLGKTGDAAFTIKSAYEDIVKEVDEWIDKQRALAVINKSLARQDEASARNMQLTNQLDDLEKKFFEKFGHYAAGYVDMITGKWRRGATNDMTDREKNWIEKKIFPVIQEIKANTTIISKAESEINAERDKLAKKYGVDVSGQEITTGGNGGGGGKGPKQDTPSTVISDYIKKRKELENQYKNGALTEEQFKDEIMDLEDTTYQAIAAFGEWSDVIKKLSKTAREEAEKLKDAFPQNQQTRQEREDKAAADKQARAEADKVKKEVEAQLKALEKFVVPKEEKRDSSGDKFKTKLEIEAEIASLKVNRSEELQKVIDDLKEGIATGDFDRVISEAVSKLFELVAALQSIKKEATDLSQKVKTSQAIEKLNKEIKDLQESTFSTMTGLAQSFDRINNSLMSMAAVFDEDIKDSPLYQSYEKFSTLLNHTIQIMESMAAVIKFVQKLSDLAAKEKAKDALIETAANKSVAASEIEKGAAAGGAAAAEGASSVAGIPIIGPVLAVAAVAAIIAAILAGMNKFATGGIVGGHSYSGDKQVARVNSGEMILNQAQQRNLLDIANGNGIAKGSTVNFKIRGTDLIGVMNNEMSRRRG